MIKDWLSRYHVRYPRSLAYMLQASEYNIRDYFAWYHRTKNFTHVEKRKHLVKTPKALLLLIMSWGVVFLMFGGIIYMISVGTAPLRYALFLVIALVSPYLLAYTIIIPLLVIKIAGQWPLEYMILRKARQKLKAHTAVKIGIAGSFGKTTMREILKTVLSEGKKVAAPPHSHNTVLGISQFIHTLKGDEDILIFELGEYYPGDVRRLCDLVDPSMGVITGINEAHLQKFKTREQTVKTIYELADYLGEKPVYVNGENELAKNNMRSGHIAYSRTSVREWNIENQKSDLSGTSFTFAKNNIKWELRSALLGLHQIGPLVAACDIALTFG
ncbi:MAG: Mur ligase family protein, partial [Patescibacteria group bacterium]